MSDTIIPVWTLGDRLAKAREGAGISVNAMAERLHVARTTISNWEHDRVQPSHSVIIAYSATTLVPVSWLIGDLGLNLRTTAGYDDADLEGLLVAAA